jgi:hypothetical protein
MENPKENQTIIESTVTREEKEKEVTDASKWLKCRFFRFIIFSVLTALVLICA